MSTLDQLPAHNDNIEAQQFNGSGQSQPLIDMANPETRQAFSNNNRDNQNAVTSSGQLVFDNPYGAQGGEQWHQGGEGGPHHFHHHRGGRTGGDQSQTPGASGSDQSQAAGSSGSDQTQAGGDQSQTTGPGVGDAGLQAAQNGIVQGQSAILQGETSMLQGLVQMDSQILSGAGQGGDPLNAGEQQLLQGLQLVDQDLLQLSTDVNQLIANQSAGGGGSGGGGQTQGGDGGQSAGSGGGQAGVADGQGSSSGGGSGTTGGDGSQSSGTTGGDEGQGSGGSGTTSGDGTSSSAGSFSSGSGGSGDGTSGYGSGQSGTDATIAALEQADPSLAQTLGDASKTLSTQGYAQLTDYLGSNNTGANPNLDSELMAGALSQAGLSSADSTALQKVEVQDMQSAQVLRYAGTTDPALAKTLEDLAPQMSNQGWNQVQTYLVNNYTGDPYMDSTMMQIVANLSGLSQPDQQAINSVLAADMPTALAPDAFAAGLQATDPTMSKTLSDASSQMSAAGYQSLESYVENNYGGPSTSDSTIMQNALTEAGLTSSDSAALSAVMQADLPNSDNNSAGAGGTTSSGAGDSSGSSTSGDNSGSSAGGDNPGNNSGSSSSTSDSSGGNNSGSSSSTSDSSGGSNSGGGSSTGDGSGGSNNSAGNYTNGGGNSGSTDTFQVGGQSLLEPPQSDTGVVTPTGSLSGDNTAYQGTISGTISGSNNSQPSAMTQGQGDGPDALQMQPTSLITTMDTQNGAGFQQKYGYFVADIKVEGTPNGWPGWFLESAAHTLNPNTDPSSEIDIMEAQTSSTNGKGLTAYNAGVHLNSSTYPGGPADQDQGPYTTGLPNISEGYHTYGMLWQPNDKNIEFYFDGKEVGYNPVYDTTDSSPMYMVLDNNNGGWSSTDPSYAGGNLDVAWVRAYQESNLLNSENDPHGTVGTNITDTNPDDSPPALSNVTWKNTFNADFTQTADYTTSSGYTSAPVLNSQEISEEHGVGSGLTPNPGADPDNTPWYEGEWVIDQKTSVQGVDAGMSSKAP